MLTAREVRIPHTLGNFAGPHKEQNEPGRTAESRLCRVEKIRVVWFLWGDVMCSSADNFMSSWEGETHNVEDYIVCSWSGQ